MHYQVVFDRITDPSQIQPAYWFYALFLAIGLASLSLSRFLVRRRRRHRHFMLVFSIWWLAITVVGTVTDVADVIYIRSQVEQGAYMTTEGCLGYFQAGDPGGAKGGDERWSVHETQFNYSQGDFRRGYHVVEPRGGAVHRDSRVRVSFVTSELYRRREIVKLAVAQHACPSAPESGR